MQPTNREDYLADQSKELDVWNKKVDELVMEVEGREQEPPQSLRDRVLDVTDQRDRVVEKMAEISQMSVDEWKNHREPVEAAWEDLRSAWNRVIVLVGKSEERV